MRNLLIISVLLFISCEELQESSNFLEYDYYMENGWEAFQIENWDLAIELFNTGLGSSTSSKYTEAYTGLGWTYLYHANTKPGINNVSLRDSLRLLAEENFQEAKSEGWHGNDVWGNTLAGMIFIYSHIADTAIASYYNNDGQDQLLWDIMEEYSSKTITESDELLDFYLDLDKDFDFEYDLCVNVDNIRIIRARTFLRLGDFESMLFELNNLSTYLLCEANLQSIEEGLNCLANLSSYLSTCN